MKTKYISILILILAVFCAHAAIEYIDYTTVQSPTTYTNYLVMTIPGVATNETVTIITTNSIVGDSLPSASAKINSDFDWLNTNGTPGMSNVVLNYGGTLYQPLSTNLTGWSMLPTNLLTSGGGGSATNAIANLNGLGTNTSFFGPTYFLGSNLVVSAVSSNGLIPTMTSDTAPSGTASASTAFTPAWQAFAGSGVSWQNGAESSSWLEYAFPGAVTATACTVYQTIGGGGTYTDTVNFQSSPDGATWTTLATTNLVATGTGYPVGFVTLTFPSTTAQYWRWAISGNRISSALIFQQAQVFSPSYNLLASTNELTISSPNGISVNTNVAQGFALNVNGSINAATSLNSPTLNVLNTGYFINSNIVVSSVGGSALIPVMTDSNAPSGLASGFNTQSGEFPWQAFGTPPNSWTAGITGNSAGVEYSFASPITAGYSTLYQIVFGGSFYTNTLYFQFSFDNTNWYTLGSTNMIANGVNFPPGYITFNFPPQTAANWRWFADGNNVNGDLLFSNVQIGVQSSLLIEASNTLQIASTGGIGINTPSPGNYTLNVNGSLDAISVTTGTETSQTNNTFYIPNVTTADVSCSGNIDAQTYSLAGLLLNLNALTNNTITGYYATNCFDVATPFDGTYLFSTNGPGGAYWTNVVSGWYLITGSGGSFFQTNNVLPYREDYAWVGNTYPGFVKPGAPLGQWPYYVGEYFPYYGFPYYQTGEMPFVTAVIYTPPVTFNIQQGTTNASALTAFKAVFSAAMYDTNYTAVATGDGFALAGEYVSLKTTTNCQFNCTVATGLIDWMAVHK